MSRPQLVVAGAGIAGLVAAIALARAGASVTVLEKRQALAEFGAGIQLAPNATRILDRLGLLKSLRDLGVEPSSVRIRRGRDGVDLARLPLGRAAQDRYGAPFLLLLRRNLQRALSSAALAEPRVALRFASDVTGATSGTAGASVALANGEILETGGYVDARGIRLAPPQTVGHYAWRALVPASRVRADALAPDTNLWLGADAHLVHYPLQSGSMVNVVAVTKRRGSALLGGADPWETSGDPKDLLAAFARWDPTARDLVAAAETWRRWPLSDHCDDTPWSSGAMTRIGDAAHPMLPFLAQGASQAIEDAMALADAVQHRGSIREAFAAYEANRHGRASKVQSASRRQGDLYHLSRPASDARDLVMRTLGGARAMARMDWLYAERRDAG